MNLKYHRGRPPRILNSQRRPPRILFSNQIKPATCAGRFCFYLVSIFLWFDAQDLGIAGCHRWRSEIISEGAIWFLTNPNHTSPNLQIMPDYLETLIFGVVWFVLVQDRFVSNKNKTSELRVSQFFSSPTASEFTGLAFSTGLWQVPLFYSFLDRYNRF